MAKLTRRAKKGMIVRFMQKHPHDAFTASDITLKLFDPNKSMVAAKNYVTRELFDLTNDGCVMKVEKGLYMLHPITGGLTILEYGRDLVNKAQSSKSRVIEKEVYRLPKNVEEILLEVSDLFDSGVGLLKLGNEAKDNFYQLVHDTRAKAVYSKIEKVLR